jgi:tRNA pseudouridine13 synthase
MLPYLTADLPGIGGTLKERPEDFFVQEIPLYEPSGEGEHVYCEIQKVGVPTFDAVSRIAKALDVPTRDIGYAGLKDAQAISRQILSIRGADAERVMALRWPDLTVLWAARHGNKLRLGHLKANRFAIKIRKVSPTAVVSLGPLVKILETRGMPNYFGEQRFGRRDNNDQLGSALICGDAGGLLSLLLGRPSPKHDDSQSLGARAAYDRGDFEQAMKLYPRHCGLERRILARFIKTGRPVAAVKAIDERLRRLWVSAVQSRLFNAVVARRIASLDRVMTGDLAYMHDRGAVFRVQDAAVEQPRADTFEISPSGPLLGFRMTLPEGEPLEIEQAAAAEMGLKPADFRSPYIGRVTGARRPLRVKPTDFELAGGVDSFGPYVTAAFTLPPGSFATTLLREIMKNDADTTAGGEESQPDDED